MADAVAWLDGGGGEAPPDAVAGLGGGSGEAPPDAVAWLGGGGGEAPRVCRHASRVLKLGCYWGFADWIAYGWAREVQVIIHVGDFHIRLFECFSPPAIHELTRSWREMHVLGVRYGADGSEVAWDFRQVNHFTGCVPCGPLEGDSLLLHNMSGTTRFLETLSDANNYLVAHYGSLGWVVLWTAANGDCGPDTCAIYEGLPSNCATWKHIRRVVHDSHLKLRSEYWYADCFKACQEVDSDTESDDDSVLPDLLSDSSEDEAELPEDLAAQGAQLPELPAAPAALEVKPLSASDGEMPATGVVKPSAACDGVMQPSAACDGVMPAAGVVKPSVACDEVVPAIAASESSGPCEVAAAKTGVVKPSEVVKPFSQDASTATWVAVTACVQTRHAAKRKFSEMNEVSAATRLPKQPSKVSCDLGKRMAIGKAFVKFEEGRVAFLSCIVLSPFLPNEHCTFLFGTCPVLFRFIECEHHSPNIHRISNMCRHSAFVYVESSLAAGVDPYSCFACVSQVVYIHNTCFRIYTHA